MKLIKLFVINILCAAFFAAPAQAALLPTVMSLEERLDSEVEKIITSGHLRPAYSMVTNLYYRNTSIVGSSINTDVFEFDDLFHNPADLFYSLSIAFPHLSSSRQTEVLNYLATEFQSYSPVLYTHIGRNGNYREINPLPESVTLGSFNITTVNPSNPSWTGWNFNPFNFYALYLYASIQSSPSTAAATYLDALTSAGHGIPQNLPSDTFISVRPHVINSFVAGYYGYLGLSKLANRTPDPSVSVQLDLALQKSVQFLRTTQSEINSLSVYEAGGFLYLVPEHGDYIRANALNDAQTNIDLYEKSAPYWMVPFADETTRVYPDRYNEGSLSHLHEVSSMFNAKAFILKETQSELNKYLQSPAVARGDLFYIQNLVATIQAPGVPLPTNPPLPTSTPTPIPVPGDANGDGVVDGVDYVVWLVNFGLSIFGGAGVGDFDNNGLVDGVDYVMWLNNYVN